MPVSELKSLKDYPTFREFLKDGYLREKESSKRTTLAGYAKRFGMSAARLNMIFAGSRNLTIESLHSIATTLRLSKTEFEYFEALVLRDQAKEAGVRRYYNQRLKLIAKTQLTRTIHLSDKQLLADWLIPAILIYLLDFEFKNGKPSSLELLNLVEMADRFKLPIARIQRLVEKLKYSGLLQIDAKDHVHIVFEKLITDAPQRDYLLAVLAQVRARVENDFQNRNALYRAFVFSLDKNLIPELRRDLIAVFETFMSRPAPAPNQTTIVQAVVGLFPILD